MIIKYNYANMLNNLIDCCKIKESGKKVEKSGKKWQIYKKSGKKVEKWKSGKVEKSGKKWLAGHPDITIINIYYHKLFFYFATIN